MVTYYNRKDLVSFGNYLLSEKRKSRYEQMDEEWMKHNPSEVMPIPLTAAERLKEVSHADVANWKDQLIVEIGSDV